MPIAAGTYTLGPEDGTLSVQTGRTGAAAKAGHDLLIHVTAWQATLVVGDDAAPSSVELDGRRDLAAACVRAQAGCRRSMTTTRTSIVQTIDDEVLKRQPIEFRSTAVQAAGDGRWSVQGDLTLVGKARAARVRCWRSATTARSRRAP